MNHRDPAQTALAAGSSSPGSATPEVPLRRDIGVVAMVPDRWGPLWQPRHHVISRLTRHFTVTWYEPSTPWRQVLARTLGPTRDRAPEGLTLDHGGPWYPRVYRPPWLGRSLERARLRAAVRGLRQQGCRQVILYAWRPEFLSAVDAVAWDGVAYHIDDEYGFSPEEVETSPAEAAFLQRADVVFIHSEALWLKKAGLTRRARRAPNGVDYARFATPAEEPAELAAIPRPRIGYAGWLKDQIDWPLLEALVERHPEWSWVLVGPAKGTVETTAALARLATRPHVHLLGPKPAADLGRWIQHLDVGIMPYRQDDYTKYIYPMKLHEYLAAGLPAVATPIPALRPHEAVVRLADGVEAWSAALREAVAPAARTPERLVARREVARHNDWDRIAEGVARELVQALEGGPQR